MIIAAAIKDKSGIVHTKVDDGKPSRHCFVMQYSGLPKGYLKFGEQGFITDTGEFLNREDGAVYALKCGQITKLKFNQRELFSEDLW